MTCLYHAHRYICPQLEHCKQKVKVSGTRTGIETAKKTTGTVAKYTSIAADALGSAIGSVANSAASRMKQKGVAKEGSSTRKAAKVGKAGIVAVVEVFDSMHDAGRQVLASGSTETATCVQYRYDSQALSSVFQSCRYIPGMLQSPLDTACKSACA